MLKKESNNIKIKRLAPYKANESKLFMNLKYATHQTLKLMIVYTQCFYSIKIIRKAVFFLNIMK